MKNTMLSIITLFRSLLLLGVFSSTFVGVAPSTAFADHVEGAGAEWIQKIQMAIGGDQAVVRALDLETNVVPSAVRVRLAAIADDQAQIWGDTILEGDYYAEEEVQLDTVEAILVDSALVGYRITYSSVAYDTSACEVSMNRDLISSGCLPGRIVESSFVAPQLDSWTRDAEAYAQFIADEA